METFVDYRYGGWPRYSIGEPEGAALLIHPSHLDSVAFLTDKQGELQGTAFFVGVDDLGKECRFTYLVTAAHVVEPFIGTTAGLLLNTTSGTREVVAIQRRAKWTLHPTEDVAVLRWEPPKHLAVSCVPESVFLSKEIQEKTQIGTGDDIHVIGLFSPHKGESKNLPVVRRGCISMMDETKVRSETGTRYTVTLAEVMSIGGVSGAPVFAQDPGIITAVKSMIPVYLYGLVHGHWDEEKAKVHTGMAAIVPVRFIRETLDAKELVEERAREREKLEAQRGPKAD